MKRLVGPARFGAALLAFACLLAGTASAAVVESVSFENTLDRENRNPAAKISEDLFRNSIVTAAGAEHNPRTVSEDVKRLMKTGFFRDVMPELSTSPAGGIRITFRLTPQYTVRNVRVEGNSLVKTKKLTAKLTQPQGALYNDLRATEDANAIRKIYEDKGYYQATVAAELRTQDGRRLADLPKETQEKFAEPVDVVYVVREAPRYKIDDIVFTGNGAFPAKTLKRQVKSTFTFWSYFFNAGYVNDEILHADMETLADFYTARGFLDFRVAKVEKTVSANGKWVVIRVALEEGLPYKIVPAEGAADSIVAIAGNTRFPKDALLKAPNKAWKTVPGFRTGDTFNSDTERRMVELVKAHYDPLGYIDLRVVPRHKLDSASHTVAVTFDITEGVPATIRDIDISGNEITKDHVIRRELPILPEDKADGAKIRAAKSRLMGLDYFDTVDVTPVATEREEIKDLDVRVAEKKTGSLQLGAGISSEESVMGMATLTQSNFDWRNWQNGFKGGGQRLMLQARVGTQVTDFNVNFTEPWFMDRPLRMDLNLHRTERDQDYFTQTMTGAGVTFERPLMLDAPEESEWRWWKHAWGYRYDYAQLGDFDDDVEKFLRDEKGGYSVSAVNYRIKRDTRDNYKAPTEGSLLQFMTEYEAKPLGSYADIYRLDAQGTKYFPLRKWVLKLEAECGVVDGLGSKDPALFDRWFAGGAGSIRGFKRRTVGPVDMYDNPTGGGSLMRGTVEFIHPIYTDMVRGSVWSDFGNVWADPYDWHPEDVNVTVGVGLQLDLPIGPVRLDYGFPVVTKEDHLGKGGRFHFNIGYMF